MDKRITVLHLIETLGKGGAEKLLVSTLKYIDRERFNPMVACLFDTLDLKQEFEKIGIPVLRLSMRNRFDWPRGIFRLARIIKENRVEIVHTHLFHANIYGRMVSLFSGLKAVVTSLHNKDYTYEDNGRISFKLRKYIDSLSGRILNSKFVAVSNAVKEDYQKQLKFKDVEVIYNGVDPEGFKTTADPAGVREKFGLVPSDFVLVNIGRLHPQKGQKFLIEAVAIASKAKKDIKLVIAGEGALEDELKARVKELNLEENVILAGTRNDICELIHASDAVVCSSIYEGVSIALLEAMICAIPIIATDIDGMKEIIRHSQEGLIVKPRDAVGLAEAVLSLVNQPYLKDKLAAKAKGRALRDFDISKNVKSFEDMYINLAANNKQPECFICGLRFSVNTIYGGYLYKDQRYNIVKCRKCGFIFLNPLPTPEVLDGVYNGNEYFDNYYATPTGIKNYIEAMEDYSMYDEGVLNRIKEYKQTGRLLDIGCAGGRFLVNAKKSGYQVFGLEPNKRMFEHARNVLKLNVLCGTLKDARFAQGRFDIIHAADVLEHILDLKKAMEIIKNLLVDDGVLVIEQPLMYNKSLFTLFLKINMFFKRNKFSPNEPTHLWEFNAATLKKFLKKTGFEVLYYKISESKAKSLTVFKEPTIKNRIGIYFKNISSFISNSILLRLFEFGDRAVVVCKKAEQEL